MSDDPSYRLFVAMSWRDVKTVKALIAEHGISDLEEGVRGLVASALDHKLPDLAKWLLESGAGVDIQNRAIYSGTALHAASKNGYADIVTMLLDKNADMNALEHNRQTALHSAVSANHLDIVKLLLERNASIEAKCMMGQTPLLMALNKCKKEIMKELINHGLRLNDADYTKWIDKECKPLHLATMQQDESLVKLLLSEGSDVNAKLTHGKAALHIAVILDDVQLVRLLLEKGADIQATDKYDNTPLHYGADFGRIEIAKILLANRASVEVVNQDGCSPLHVAAKVNNPTVVELLLDSGADVNAEQYIEWTALHVASEAGNNDVVKLLIERGASVNAVEDRSQTSLHFAADGDKSDVVETLLNSGALIEAKNSLRETALHLCGIRGSPLAAKVLLEHGANVNALNVDSKTPLDYANQLLEDLNPKDKCARTYRATVEVFVQHIIGMIARDLHVSKQNLKALRSYYEERDISKDPVTEVADMKATKIADSTVSYYDIIIADIHKLASYAKNKRIVKTLKSRNLKSHFPLYSKIINRNIRIGQTRVNLVNSSRKSLTGLVGHALPDPFAIQLSRYLNDNDLGNLIKADPTRK